MFYRNISGLMLSDLPARSDHRIEAQIPTETLGLLDRFFITGTVLAAPFVALFVVFLLQGLSAQ